MVMDDSRTDTDNDLDRDHRMADESESDGYDRRIRTSPSPIPTYSLVLETGRDQFELRNQKLELRTERRMVRRRESCDAL